MKKKSIIGLSALGCIVALQGSAQSYNWVGSSTNTYWKQKTVSLRKGGNTPPGLSVDDKAPGSTFGAWGTCFNELGWNALNILPAAQKATILKQLFSPGGDLRFAMGRFSMNANDYARSWYSCDEVSGDFGLINHYLSNGCTEYTFWNAILTNNGTSPWALIW